MRFWIDCSEKAIERRCSARVSPTTRSVAEPAICPLRRLSEYETLALTITTDKASELPAATAKFDYALEYGTNTLEIHRDAIERGQRVLIVDDLLATGGTASATAKLASSLGAEIAGLGFVVELDFLKGREMLQGYDVFSLLHYEK